MSNGNPVLVQPSEQWVCLRDQEQNDPDDFCPFCKATTVQKRGEQNRGRNIKQELSPWSCLSVNFESFELKVFCEGAPGDPAAKPNQRLSETFHHLDAQLHHREHQSYRCSGETFSTLKKKPESCEKSRQKIQGRRGRVAEAWSSNFGIGGGQVFGVGGGQVGSNLVPSFIFTLAWPDPFQITEQHFSQQSDFFF